MDHPNSERVRYSSPHCISFFGFACLQCMLASTRRGRGQTIILTPSKHINYNMMGLLEGKSPYEKLWDHLGKGDKLDSGSTKHVLKSGNDTCLLQWEASATICNPNIDQSSNSPHPLRDSKSIKKNHIQQAFGLYLPIHGQSSVKNTWIPIKNFK